MEEIQNAPLARFTTLKVGGEAQHFCQPANVNELIELLTRLKDKGEPWHILGGGSNMLISSEGVAGTVIRMTQLTTIRNPEPYVLDVDAGSRLPHSAKYAGTLGLSGLEFAVGIPGTIGGAVVMNAGAHGSDMSKIVQSATIFDTTTLKVIELTNEQLKFEYRRSFIDPTKHIVLSARLKMTPDTKENIQKRIQENEDYRWRTQPIGWPNAGSTFTNPPSKSAGYLLEQAGAKHFKEGAAAVSAIHANFVINLGGASSKEITDLLRRMQESVYNTFQIELHPEWKRMGVFNENETNIWNNKSSSSC